MIQPKVGYPVLYVPFVSEAMEPGDKAAIVARSNEDGTVNLAVFDQNGMSYPRTRVRVLQPGEKAPVTGQYCYDPQAHAIHKMVGAAGAGNKAAA